MTVFGMIVKAILIGICGAQAVLESLYYIHILQLNSYRPERYRKWMRENDSRVMPNTRFLSAAALALVMLVFCWFNEADEWVPWVLIGASVLCLISMLKDIPKKAKKPLVYTPRVRRLLATTWILVAAALVGAWLLPLRLTAMLLLLAVLLGPILVALANRINIPLERHIAGKYIKDAKRILSEMPHLKIIGVTGSYGKTSTKLFLQALLAEKYNVLATPESYNTPMGVVRAIRERLRPSHEYFICEMGAKNKGDIKEICDIVHPHHGMITAIGEQHLETFKTIDTIVSTKFELADALPADGLLFLNTDNEYIAAKAEAYPHVIRYGLEDGAEYQAIDIVTDENGSHFTMIAPGGERCEYTTRMLGRHNIQNLAGCIAVAHRFGISLADLRSPVRRMKPVPHRLQLLQNGYIDDAYNSNPAGFRSALDVLGGMSDTRRVLVTPGMVELGDRQEALNEELGAYAASRCDYAVLVGEKQAPPLQRGLLAQGFDPEHIFVAFDLHQGLSFVQSLPPVERQVVLLENDLPDNFI
ncbi:MAG: UDP-N-acetylmuramoyl-tripeptide--D-alanyl-D-alanine ligase [Clostridia bacterium]|nr:UDP-N-acetylmuramoyl-tripeptide--D-alanyl-D-alanine ligase [Clostridia bacterium]